MTEHQFRFTLDDDAIMEGFGVISYPSPRWVSMFNYALGILAYAGLGGLAVLIIRLGFGINVSSPTMSVIVFVLALAFMGLAKFSHKAHLNSAMTKAKQSPHRITPTTMTLNDAGFRSENRFGHIALPWDLIDPPVRGKHVLHIKSRELTFLLPYAAIGDDEAVRSLENDIDKWRDTAVFS